jgi:phosphocarrier protein
MVDADGLLKHVEITNDLGLHARSAAKLVKIAEKAVSRIWLEKDGQKADAFSVIDILTLNCPKGSEITLHAESHEDLPVLNEMAELIIQGFGE